MAHDSSTGKPSVTLLAFYSGLVVSIGSLLAYHFSTDLLGPVTASLTFLMMTFIFYRLRGLDKISVNLKERSFELEDVQETTNEKEKNEN